MQLNPNSYCRNCASLTRRVYYYGVVTGTGELLRHTDCYCNAYGQVLQTHHGFPLKINCGVVTYPLPTEPKQDRKVEEELIAVLTVPKLVLDLED